MSATKLGFESQPAESPGYQSITMVLVVASADITSVVKVT
jgi:hypothetical protein